MKGKRVLVTGGSGFIGSHLVSRLLHDGATVAVLARYGNVMRNERLLRCWHDLHVIEADLRNRGALDAATQFRPETVFHLAAYNHVGQSFAQVEECFDVNAKGTANLLDTCGHVEKFIYMSTSETYGHQQSVPFVESMTPQPISPYGITKYAGEMYCRMKQGLPGGESIVIVRPFNTYGPYQSTKAVIPELMINCLQNNLIQTTKGEQTREFNYVTDIVDGLVKAALYKGAIEGPMNLATGEEVAIRDLVKKIAAVTNSKSQLEIGTLPYRPTEIWRMYADSSRARQLLGWAPKTRLDEGLRLTAGWFRQYLERCRDGSI